MRDKKWFNKLWYSKLPSKDDRELAEVAFNSGFDRGVRIAKEHMGLSARGLIDFAKKRYYVDQEARKALDYWDDMRSKLEDSDEEPNE